MAYYEITLNYGGCLLDEKQFDESEVEEMTKYIQEAKKSHFFDVEPVEIYGLHHPHEPEMEECLCVQYLTDHHPLWRNVRSRRDVHEQLEDWESKTTENIRGLVGKDENSG